MLIYLLKSGACLGVFILFYKLFLEKESIHQFKRYFLLLAVFTSFIIPLITFESYLPVAELSKTNISELVLETESNSIQADFIAIILPKLLWAIYCIGLLFFGLKFSFNFSSILLKIKRNPKQRAESFTNVLLKDFISPHTFFNFIFLNKQQFESKQIPAEVLLHEQTHAKQKHSVDVLFIEFIQVLFWFNPLVYLFRHAIKLNHEFLADQAVINEGIIIPNYQKILLNFSNSTSNPSLANAINYSSIKKRFTIMKKTSTPSAIWLRSLVLLPLLAVLIYGFSEREVIEQKNPSSNTDQVVQIQEKATPEQVAEYNKLAKHYNAMDKSNMRIQLKDVKHIHYIYKLMTAEQKKNAAPFPDFPPPPPPVNEMDGLETVNEKPIPPPPPPLPSNATMAQRKKYKKVTENYIKKYGYSYKDKYGDVIEIVEDVPPPPPMPPDPLDHIIDLAKKGADFYYEGKKISSDKAIALVKKNKKLNIQIRDHDSSTPQVKISKKPIQL